MANQIAVTELVGNVMLAELANNNSLLLTGARTYESDFQMAEYRIGDTVQIRRQNNFLVNDGRVGVLQDVIDRTEPLTINHQLNVMVEFSSRELTLFVDTGAGPFNERVIRPAIQAITKRAEDLIANSAVLALNYTSGNPAAPVNSFAVVDLVYARMQEQSIQINNDGYMALAPRQASALKSANQNAFNDILNTDISFASSLGHYSVFDLFSNQSIPRHLVGAGAVAGAVATTVVSGESSIDLNTLGASVANVFRAGDVVRFTGINAVNPISLTDNGQLMEFVVLADVSSTAGGLATIDVYPPVISDPASPYRNVTTPIIATTPITLLGTGGSIYNVNVAYAPRGLDIVIPPMEVLNNVDTSVVTDKDLNISLRVERQGMIQNDVNILRIDMLLGFKWHPDYALKVPSL